MEEVKIPRLCQTILDAMVWLESGRIPMPWHHTVVAIAAGHLPGGGSFKEAVAWLKANDLVITRTLPADSIAHGPRGSAVGLVLEQAGRTLAYVPGFEFSVAEYWTRMDGHLRGLERSIVAVLRGAHRIPVDELASAVERHRMDDPFQRSLGRLRELHILHAPAPDVVVRTDVLWPLSVFEIRERRAT